MKKNFTLSCAEASQICDKGQYNEAAITEKIALNIHLLYCRPCRKYSARNSKLSKVFKKSKLQRLNHDEKQRIQEQLNKGLK